MMCLRLLKNGNGSNATAWLAIMSLYGSLVSSVPSFGQELAGMIAEEKAATNQQESALTAKTMEELIQRLQDTETRLSALEFETTAPKDSGGADKSPLKPNEAKEEKEKKERSPRRKLGMKRFESGVIHRFESTMLPIKNLAPLLLNMSGIVRSAQIKVFLFDELD